MATIKGQNLRVFANGQCLAAAQTSSIHVALMTEESSTKDSTDDWNEVIPVGHSWDATATALVVIDSQETANMLEDLFNVGAEVSLSFSLTNGNKNRVLSETLVRGTAVISDLSVQSDNRQVATYTAKFEGRGDLIMVVPPIADYINSLRLTYQGIANLYYPSTSKYYAVGVGDSDYMGRYLFPLSHMGESTKVTEFTDHVYGMTDYADDPMDASLYDALKAIAEADGMHMVNDPTQGIYSYYDIDDTGIIGAPYIENL